MQFRIEKIVSGTRQATAVVVLREGSEYRRSECRIPNGEDINAVIESQLSELWLHSTPFQEGAVFWMQLEKHANAALFSRALLEITRQLDASEYPELAYLVSAGVRALGDDPQQLARYNKLVNAFRNAPTNQQGDFTMLLLTLLTWGD